MTNQFEHVPEVAPQLITPEIKKEKEEKIPIEVINGALSEMGNEEDTTEEGEIRKPTIH